MQLIHPFLAWAFLLVAVPPIIHLINLVRQRRIQWAAMDFLLQSYKRHRTWVWLKQLLLLLLRMAAIAAIVLMLAQLVTPDRWSATFGGKTKHHYILLDDSFSMSDQAADGRIYDRATQAISRIGARVANENNRQKITLLRYSQVTGSPASGEQNLGATPATEQPADEPPPSDHDATEAEAEDADAADTGSAEAVAADADARDADADPSLEITAVGNFEEWLETKRRQADVTSLAGGPQAALDAVQQLLGQSRDEDRVVYVISDFRNHDWENPSELATRLDALAEADCEIHFISCAAFQRPNLAITSLIPTSGTRAAGVPMFVVAKVTNHSQQTAHNVELQISTEYFDPARATDFAPTKLMGSREELPTEMIGEIGPGETVSRQVQVYFPGHGQHVVEASIPDDAVAADNRRWLAVDVPAAVPVLIIDGDSAMRNAYFLASVFDPSGNVQTGLQPEIKDLAYLRDAEPDELQAYHAIYLLDIDLGSTQLAGRAVKNLETHVASGGGLCWFLGPNGDIDFFTGLYRDGEGLFPLPLDRVDLLDRFPGESGPDIQIDDHPAFHIFRGDRSPFLSGILVDQFYRPPAEWKLDPQSTTQIIARLRGGQPLMVEKQYGDGRIVAVLTTLAPEWNNWALSPSFVVVLLDLQAHLTEPRRLQPPRAVGTPIQLALDSTDYRADWSFVFPDPLSGADGLLSGARRLIDRQAVRPTGNEHVLTATLGGGRYDGFRSGETDVRGIYEIWTTTSAGGVDVHRYALNVEPAEGDLAIVTRRQLAAKLHPVNIHFHTHDELQYELAERAGFNWSEFVLYGLVLLLFFEQFMAYSCGYHAAGRRGAS